MRPLRCWALATLLSACAAQAPAQLPDSAEMAAAFRAAEPQARLAGLALQPGALWWAALRERSPLVAAYSRGACQLGFAPYSPGRDYRWLFPALPPAQRAAWLAGLVQHELAHCAEQAEAQAPASVYASVYASAQAPAQAPDRVHGQAIGQATGQAEARAQAVPDAGPAGADARVAEVRMADARVAGAPAADALVAGGRGTRWHEVLADLAFALHVDPPGSDTGAQQVALMATLRAQHARQDPAHDTSPELQCYLQQRQHFKPDGAWLQRLQAWRQHCWSGRTGG